jgi:pantetheine-phosphate adenylyltransferase
MIQFNDQIFFKEARSMQDCIAHEIEQFKINQSLNFNNYKNWRIDFLKPLPNSKINSEFIAHYQPKIAVFAGSFNPFHKGHYNVLQKAEKIFDKVIIAFGKNPDKTERTWEIPRTIRNRQIEEYNGLVTDFIETLKQDVVVIRGLRNATDFSFEQNQYRYIQELMPDIKIINIFCDKEFEHISSSGIRTLEKYNKHLSYLLD